MLTIVFQLAIACIYCLPQSQRYETMVTSEQRVKYDYKV